MGLWAPMGRCPQPLALSWAASALTDIVGGMHLDLLARRTTRVPAALSVPTALLSAALLSAVAVALAGCSSGGGTVALPAAVTGPAVAVPADAFAATLVRDVDGDTVIARTTPGGPALRVRVIGIDTPESVKPGEGVACYGHQASAFTRALLPAGTVFRAAYESDRQDRYGRELWDIWLPDGRSLESVLAASGVARVDPFPPNVWHADVLAAASRDARAARRGLWGACSWAAAYPDEARDRIGPDG